MESKAQLLKELNESRENLWRELASISDSTELSPGMTKREIFAHIAGWESLVFEALRELIYGIPAYKYPYHGVDAINHDFLSHRQAATVESAKLECEINRFAIDTILAAIPEADYGNVLHLPWGDETVVQNIRGAISHENEHKDEVLKLK